MYIRYGLLVIVDLIASFLNYFLAPIVVLFANKQGWLPRWLWWFQTPGDSLNGSIGWQTVDRRFIEEKNSWHRWYNRVTWLYRNSIYGFAIDVLGAKPLPGDVVVVTGEPRVSNHKRDWCEGTVRYTLLREGKPVYFQSYTVKRWSNTRYMRINLGWKLWSFSDAPTKAMQFTFSPNPFRKLPEGV